MSRFLLRSMMTPQAAPETAGLRRMRFAWMALCLALGLGIAEIRPIVDLFGNWGALTVFLLTVATPVQGLIYFRRKNKADAACASDARS